MRVRHHASGVSYQLSTAAGLSDLKGPLTKFDQIYRPVILNWRHFGKIGRHLSDTKITAVGQMSLSDKCPDRRHLSESGSHLSDTKITAVGQMSLSDKCPDRRHLSESGLISFSQAWCRAGVVACTRIPMLQEDVIS